MHDPTSALIVSGERALRAEFPDDALAYDVLRQIGSGEMTFSNIGRAAGGLQAMSLNRALDLLTTKRIVAKDLPLSSKVSKEARYRVTDSYLRFWLTFIRPGVCSLSASSPLNVSAAETAETAERAFSCLRRMFRRRSQRAPCPEAA